VSLPSGFDLKVRGGIHFRGMLWEFVINLVTDVCGCFLLSIAQRKFRGGSVLSRLEIRQPISDRAPESDLIYKHFGP